MKKHLILIAIFLGFSPLAHATTGDIGTYILMGVSFLIAIVVVLLVSLLSAIYYYRPKVWLLSTARGIAILGAILSFICFCASFISAFDHSTALFPALTGLIFLICIGSYYLLMLSNVKQVMHNKRLQRRSSASRLRSTVCKQRI
jgi:amino acid transporter